MYVFCCGFFFFFFGTLSTPVIVRGWSFAADSMLNSIQLLIIHCYAADGDDDFYVCICALNTGIITEKSCRRRVCFVGATFYFLAMVRVDIFCAFRTGMITFVDLSCFCTLIAEQAEVAECAVHATANVCCVHRCW